MVENPAGAGEISEPFFFRSKFTRVRNKTASRPPRRMLDVQHFVIQNVLDGHLRHAGMIHSAIQ